MKKEALIGNLISRIEALTYANFFTGYWDGKRNEMRKVYDANFIRYLSNEDVDGTKDLEMKTALDNMMRTERESRKNCELRCKNRTEIDYLVEMLVR